MAHPWKIRAVDEGTNGAGHAAPLPDLEATKRRILDGLDIAAEFAALGVEFTAKAAKPDGWRECRAVGRKDAQPSAAVHVRAGLYLDSGGADKAVNLWDFALAHGNFGQFRDVLKHYAGKAGVELGPIPSHGEGRIREATYLYRDEDGKVRYAVFRYRTPNGKKTFSQRPPDGKGGWQYGAGCMEGVGRLPYRLPELLTSELTEPVFVVEGEKVADRLAALGLIATTNSEGSQATDRTWPQFVDYFAGRKCVVLPDNDTGGRKHARKVCDYLKPVAAWVRLLELPELPPKGDAADWLDTGGTKEALLDLALAAPLYEPEKVNGQAHHADEAPKAAAGPVEGDEDAHRLARLFLDSRRHADGLTLRYWLEEWHRWDGACWRVVGDREVHAEVTAAIKAEFDRLAATRGGQPKGVTTRLVGNVALALRSLALLPTKACPRQPAWLSGEPIPPPAECLPASNGIVHLSAFVAGRPAALLPPSPRFFSPSNLGYAFDPDAPPPVEWLRFLADLWGDDGESIGALQEWFGYLLAPDTSLQKILMLIGPKRSGKGTIGRVLRALVGPGNVVAPTLSGLATQFGLAPLIGKSVALIADARLGGRSDGQVIVERLLSISGEDAQTIDRKHLSSWTGELPTRFALISNELPKLGDSSGALAGRMILLRLTRSFYGEEDPTLTGRLLAELPGILLWAIQGWERLRERGCFLQPTDGRELLDDLDEISSPISAFVAERCELVGSASTPVATLYSAWKDWCKERGREHPGEEHNFGRILRAAVPSLRSHRPGTGGSRPRHYKGIQLSGKTPF